MLYSLQQQQQYVVDPQADQKHLVNPEFYNDLAQQQQQVSRFHGKINKKKFRQFFREIEIRLYSIQQQHYVVDPQADQKPFLNPEFNDLLVEYQNWEMQQQQLFVGNNLQNQTIYNGVNENNENVLVNNGANAGSDGMDTNESTSTTSPNRSENEIPSPPPPPQQQVEFSNYGESISELLDRQYCYSHSVATIY